MLKPCLVGGQKTILKNDGVSSSMGKNIYDGQIKNVPNHQPAVNNGINHDKPPFSTGDFASIHRIWENDQKISILRVSLRWLAGQFSMKTSGIEKLPRLILPEGIELFHSTWLNWYYCPDTIDDQNSPTSFTHFSTRPFRDCVPLDRRG